MEWYEGNISTGQLWDTYRAVYDQLTFADRKHLAQVWYPKLTDQKCFKPNPMLEAFAWLSQVSKENISIVEMGCWRGQLAGLILGTPIAQYIKFWLGFDISDPAINNTHCKHSKFGAYAMNDWFHNMEMPKFNTFVASHIFEHLTLDEIDKVVQKAFQRGAVNLILEVPMASDNPDYVYDWAGYCGGHVLLGSRNDLVKRIRAFGYTRKWEYLKPEHKAWVTVWRLT